MSLILKPIPGLLPRWDNNSCGIPAPVSAWIMNEGSGGKIYDISLNGRNGEFQNSPTWVSEGVLFDATTEHIKGPNGGHVLESMGTIVIGYKKTNTPAGYYYFFVLDDDAAEFSLYLNPDAGASYWDINANSLNLGVDVKAIIVDGKYHNIVFAWDDATNKRQIYVDGQNFIDSTQAFTWDAAGVDDHDLCIGGRKTGADRYCGGIISYCYIYDYVLTPTQIAYIHQHPYYAWEYPEIWELYAAAAGEEHQKNLNDTINITDARIASFGLNKADSISLSDSISKGFGLNKADSIILSDSIIKTPGLNKGDTINLSDTVSSKAFGLNKTDNIALSDSIAKSFGFSKADTINMTDEISTLIAIIKNLADTINMSDAISSKTFGLNKADIISLSDNVAKEFGLNKADTINMTDEAIKAFGLSLGDSITLSDSLDSAVLSAIAALYNFLAKNKTFNFDAKNTVFNFNAKSKTFNFNAKPRP